MVRSLETGSTILTLKFNRGLAEDSPQRVIGKT